MLKEFIRVQITIPSGSYSIITRGSPNASVGRLRVGSTAGDPVNALREGCLSAGRRAPPLCKTPALT